MAETTAHDIQAKELNMLLVFKEFCDVHIYDSIYVAVVLLVLFDIRDLSPGMMI